MSDGRFPARLKKARKKADYTQMCVAEELNISQVSVSKYENGVCEPDMNTLIQFAELFGVSIDWLIGKSKKRKKIEKKESFDKVQNEYKSEAFPLKLKKARKKTGMSQLEVAELLNTSQNNISRYESGKSQPSLKALIKLTLIYKTTSDWLLGLTNENPAI